MTIKGFRFEPVRWATSALALITALIAVNAMVHLLPEGWTPWLLGAEGLLTLLLGKSVRDRVTALAAPRDALDRPLVPLSSAKPPESGASGGIGGAGMHSW